MISPPPIFIQLLSDSVWPNTKKLFQLLFTGSPYIKALNNFWQNCPTNSFWEYLSQFRLVSFFELNYFLDKEIFFFNWNVFPNHFIITFVSKFRLIQVPFFAKKPLGIWSPWFRFSFTKFFCFHSNLFGKN